MFANVDRFILDEHCSSSKTVCWEFGAEQFTKVSDPYNEINLPNLRAEYVKYNISSEADECQSAFSNKPSIRILDGIDTQDIAGPSRTVLGWIIIGHSHI